MNSIPLNIQGYSVTDMINVILMYSCTYIL